MKTREWNKVRSELNTEVRVQLTNGADAGSGHTCKAEVVEVTIDWGGELQGTEADVGRTSLPMYMHSSAFSTTWLTERVALYGSMKHGGGEDRQEKDKTIVVAKRRIHSDICARHTRI